MNVCGVASCMQQSWEWCSRAVYVHSDLVFHQIVVLMLHCYGLASVLGQRDLLPSGFKLYTGVQHIQLRDRAWTEVPYLMVVPAVCTVPSFTKQPAGCDLEGGSKIIREDH